MLDLGAKTHGAEIYNSELDAKIYDTNLGAKIYNAELGAKIRVDATQAATPTGASILSAMAHGEETCYLGAVGHGADSLGPKTPRRRLLGSKNGNKTPRGLNMKSLQKKKAKIQKKN